MSALSALRRSGRPPAGGLEGGVARAERRAQDAGLRRRARVLGVVSVSAVAVLIAAEAVRVWRLGKLPQSHGDQDAADKGGPLAPVRVLHEGYRVSSTRENVVVNMVTAFIVTFGITRGITHTIRVRGGIGPIKDIQTAGGRHIHHFIPGMFLAGGSGGAAIGLGSPAANRWLAIPFGVGTALVLDEAALLLELEDVYWSEEGILSVEIAFAVTGLLGAVAYAIQIRRRGRPGSELDWRTAAKAWEDLDVAGRTGRGGPTGAVPG